MNYILFEDADNNLEWMPVNENGNFSVDSEQKVWKRRRLLDGCLNRLVQEGYIEELTRLSQCLNAKTGFVHF